jgi:hypothetical protein
VDCPTDRVMEQHGIDDRDDARREVLAAVSG